MRSAAALAGAGALLLALAAPAFGASKNVRLVDNLREARNATAINFMQYDRPRGERRRGKLDVMLVTGRFGLKSYSLQNPRNPRLLDELTPEQLRLNGDPPVDFTPNADGAPRSTFWQNEDMDVDRRRKLALLSRDPRAYAGSTTREPGEPDPNGATNIAGVYVVDAKNPRNLRLLSFVQLPTGHTTTCINRCRWLWTGGPAATTTQQAAPLNWQRGRPIIVTDLRNPRQPRSHPDTPVDLLRVNGDTTGYSHDVQVDDRGIAWVSGEGGTRGYWTRGQHRDPVTGETRIATPLAPIPYAGGGLEPVVVQDTDGGFEHNAERPVGRSAPKGDPRYRRGQLLLATEEDFGEAEEGCRNQGQFTIASLAGSHDGDAWRPGNRQRLRTVGSWSPYQKPGSRRTGGPFNELADFCSAHYFDVQGSQVAYAWYGEGTRFLDISDPRQPIQYAYWRPSNGIVWASYFHKGYVYTADRTRGVDVLRLTKGARQARRARREVVASAPSRAQRRFLAKLAWQYKAEPGTAGLCLLQSQ
jgi:hypothetical protein